MNSINIIAPYKYYGSWVFDDARVGLQQEPFVAGADIMMECLVADIHSCKRECNNSRILLSSALRVYRPGCRFKLL
jgi:hypothetical protein